MKLEIVAIVLLLFCYRPNEPQYSVLLGDFLQNSMPKRQLRRKAPKQKAT
ncbi:hypothetical protein V6Z11_D06G109200 [Gossypium hirsutum]